MSLIKNKGRFERMVWISVFTCFSFILSSFVISCSNGLLTEVSDDVDVSSSDANYPLNLSKDTLFFNLFANNSINHQSAASFRDYCVMITQGRDSLMLYNLSTKKMLCHFYMDSGLGQDYMGSDLYHSNQASFGIHYYDPQDAFPLLYISQRASFDKRCFVEVFRLQAFKTDLDQDYTSISATLVQTIYFPKMNETNSLGNVNCVINPTNSRMYTYSRNMQLGDANYGLCKISCFDIPTIHDETIILEEKDIRSSFLLNSSAINMQGACIKDGVLYIGQGYMGAGYIYFNLIDLKRKTLSKRWNLLRCGIIWEPEGCFTYNDKLMITEGCNIWEIQFGKI